MQGRTRKAVQALLYEAVAVLCVSPALALFYDQGLVYSTTLAVVISAIAMFWNIAYNAAFEAWETRQISRARTLRRRALHALGFEGGLVLVLLPVVAYWLDISWLAALATNLSLFAFFLVYAFVFQWAFDRFFDVPNSAKEVSCGSS